MPIDVRYYPIYRPLLNPKRLDEQRHYGRIRGFDLKGWKPSRMGESPFPVGRARVHLQELIDQMSADELIDEIDFGIQLGHLYGHLNRCWNGRRLPGEAEDQWYSDENSSFPSDIQIT